jgi:hypothetical protein
MKNLLLYTCHRQLEEIEYSSFFFNRSKFLTENFDVFIHCNNQNRTINDLKSRAKFNTKVDILVTTKNTGYNYGGIEATSDLFELFKQYTMVIQTHPDCYFVDTKHLENSYNNKFDVMVSPFFHIGRMAYNTDFFCFKPKTNFLSSCHENWRKNPDCVPEHFLYDTLRNEDLSVVEIERYPNLNGAGYRDVDLFGLWHEHDNDKVKKIINEKV